MKQVKKPATRREFLGSAAAASVAVAFGVLQTGVVQAGGHLPKVSPDDPTAKSLKYVDQSTMDGQICSGCQLYTGTEGKSYGPCAIFPGKEVAANGWCSSFVKKAA